MSAAARTGSRRGLVAGGALVVALLVVAVLLAGQGSGSSSGPPLSPQSTAADGTRALVLLLERYGASVRLGDITPPRDVRVALLLRDRLDERQSAAARRWVEDGGTLVVADPSSTLSAAATTSADGEEVARGRCDIDGLDGVDSLRTGATGLTGGGGALYRVGEDQSCFGDGEHAFVVRSPHGQGQVLSIGSADPFTNDLLDDADDSVLAVRLLAAAEGATVAVLDPNPPGQGRTGLLDLIPSRVVQAILQLLVAFTIYAIWRGWRLGRPVREPQPVALAGSGLVSAVGQLHHRFGGASKAAAELRADVRRLLVQRYGLPAGALDATIADVVAQRTGLDRERVHRALGGTHVLDDDQLVALAAELDQIRQEALDVRR